MDFLVLLILLQPVYSDVINPILKCDSISEDDMKPIFHPTPDDYKIYERPRPEIDEPLLVEVNVLIKDIIKVDTKTQSIITEVVIILQWMDERIWINEGCQEDELGRYLVLPGEYTESIWMPDIFI